VENVRLGWEHDRMSAYVGTPEIHRDDFNVRTTATSLAAAEIVKEAAIKHRDGVSNILR
jgi:hypothetical protein